MLIASSFRLQRPESLEGPRYLEEFSRSGAASTPRWMLRRCNSFGSMLELQGTGGRQGLAYASGVPLRLKF